MRNFIWITNAILLVLLNYTITSHCSEEKASQSNKDLISVDFSKTDLTLSLLGTVMRDGFGTAIIKNTSTGALKAFAEGDIIDLIDNEKVKISSISNCVIMIERKGRHETLSCHMDNASDSDTHDESLSEAVAYRLFSPLAQYKIVSSHREDKNERSQLAFRSSYENEIIATSARHGVDPYLVKAVIKVESNYNPKAISSKKAMGMMQLIPETASDYGVENPFDPDENIDGGVRFLRDLLNYFNGDPKLALAAYNAGKGAVVKHGFQIPPYTETIDYVDRVLGYYSLLKGNR
ncbi:MAG: lytic transglycosylase domain-containing protein [Thermodesulfobacteriota bacterium]